MNNNRVMNERWWWKGATTTTTTKKSEIGHGQYSSSSSHSTTMNENRHSPPPPLRTISQRQLNPRVTIRWVGMVLFSYSSPLFFSGVCSFRSSVLISERDTYFILNKWDWIIYLGIWCGRNLFSAKRNERQCRKHDNEYDYGFSGRCTTQRELAKKVETKKTEDYVVMKGRTVGPYQSGLGIIFG